MRNNITRNIWLILCFCIFPTKSMAQILDNKINIYVEKALCTFHGERLIQEGNFSYPSLNANFNKIEGFSLKVLYKSHRNISLGIEATLLQAFDWKYSGNLDYEGARTEIKSFSPIFQFHNKFLKSNLFNRGKITIELMPIIGSSNLTLRKPLFYIQNNYNVVSSPLKSSDLFYGFKGSLGFEWALSQYLATAISYSYQHDWIRSAFYCDTQFAISQLSFGIVFKLIKDKRYLLR
jgi:hypothetical protein